MPTFKVYKDGAFHAEVKGANENAIRKLVTDNASSTTSTQADTKKEPELSGVDFVHATFGK